MLNYLIAIGATVLLTGDFASQKSYQRIQGATAKAGFLFNSVQGVFVMLLFLVLTGFSVGFSGYSLLMATAFTTLCFTYSLIGFKIMEYGSMSVYTVFLMAGGMTIPYVWGLLFLNEAFSWFRMAGLVLILAAVVITGGKMKLGGWKPLVLCILVFMLNGFVSVVSKLHAIETEYPTVSSLQFVFWTAAAKFILCGGAFAALSLKRGGGEKFAVKPKGIMWVFLSAVFGNISYFMQLLCAERLPASVLYPIVTGGSVIMTALSAWLFFKEKPDKRSWIGILICFAGTCMVLW